MAFYMYFLWLWLGTNWCGPGNIADNYYDLGRSWKTDMCCRDHDYCFDSMNPGEHKHGLYNPKDAYVVSHCDCEEEFRKCLRKAGGWAGQQVGRVYFNMQRNFCFREDYPKRCIYMEEGWWQYKCLDYYYDTRREKRYQWFDSKFF